MQIISCANHCARVGRYGAFLVLGSLLLLAPLISLAQDVSADASGSALSELDISALETRLAAIESSDFHDGVQKSVLNGLYSSAIEALKAAAVDRARAEEFRELLAGSGSELAAFERAVQSVVRNPRAPNLADLSNEALRLQLSSERSTLSSLRSELQEREADIDLLRNEQPQVKLAAAEADLAQMESLTPVSSGPQDAETFEARSVLQRARRLALRARINLLDQKRISYEARQALASAAVELLKARIERSQNVVAYLETESLARQNLRVDDTLVRAEMMAREAGELSPELEAYLAENRVLSSRLSERIAKTSVLARTSEAQESDLSRLKKAYSTLTEQLRVAGFNISPSLATALRKEREQLTMLVSRHGVSGRDIQQEIIDSRLEQIQLDARLSTEQGTVVTRLLAAEGEVPRDSVSLFVEQIVGDRYRITGDLLAATGDYVAALGRSQSAINNLNIVFAKYQELVDELLFWVPSAAFMRADNLQLLLSRATEILAPAHLMEVFRNVSSALFASPFRFVAALLGLAGLVLSKPRILRALQHSGDHVGKVQHDRFRDTLWAVVLTLLLSLPFALLLFLCGRVVAATGRYEPLVSGLQGAALACFVLVFFSQLCRPEGLGARHFKWPKDRLGRLRRHLRWYTLLVVPCTMVTAATSKLYGFVASDTLGVLAFVIVAVATAGFAHLTLKPSRWRLAGAVSGSAEMSPAKAPLAGWLLYCITVGLPLVLAILSLIGFYYTSAQLQIRLFYTAIAVATAIVLFFLAVRLLAISQRRLRFKQIVEERRMAKERQDEHKLAAQSGEAVPEVLDLGQLDLVTVGTQTRSLARLVVILLCAFAMWSIWSGLLPVLGVFDDFVLWQVNTGTEDNIQLKDITMRNIVIACLSIGVIILAMRNLPGLIDIIVLSRLDVEPGTNYAITSILNYFILFSGLLFVFYLLGVQWSKLQWLVAALGVGLGFGLQEIVANFVSGLLILFERPIRVGDTVTIGGNIGTVTKIRIRATTVLDWDRKEQIIPNKTFVTEQLTNWTLTDPITRIIIRVGVSYKSDVEHVHKVLTELVNSHERALRTPPPSVFFTGFGDSSLNFEIRVFVSRVVDLMPLTHELNTLVFKKLRENGIEIPFPQRDLHLRSSDLDPGALS